MPAIRSSPPNRGLSGLPPAKDPLVTEETPMTMHDQSSAQSDSLTSSLLWTAAAIVVVGVVAYLMI